MKHVRLAFLAPLLLVSLAVAAVGGLFLSRQFTQASHNPPVATFSIDANVPQDPAAYAAAFYEADPDGDGMPEDNKLVAGTIESCISVPSPGTRVINIVGKNMKDVGFYDINLLFDPQLVRVAAAVHTPFSDAFGAATGFINLPWDEVTSSRAQDSPVSDIDNTNGEAFFSGVLLGGPSGRTFEDSPDEPHVGADEPARPYGAGPGGVPLLKLTITLQAAAAGKVVNLDLANEPPPDNDTNDYGTLLIPGASPLEEVVPVPDANLFDGQIAVGVECPPPTPTPTPSGTRTPTATPGSPTPTATPGSPTPTPTPEGTLTPTPTPTPEGTPTPTPTACGAGSGDVNGQGGITITDALLVAQIVAGVIGEDDVTCGANSDCSGDANISITDALLIAQIVADIITACRTPTPTPTPPPTPTPTPTPTPPPAPTPTPGSPTPTPTPEGTLTPTPTPTPTSG